MAFKSLLLRNIILPLGDRLFGQRMMARLKFLEKAQYWPREKILAKQANDLKQLIHIAYNEVPFYKKLMDDIEVKPDEIKTPEDLSKLPIVSKDMLRSGYPHLVTRNTGQATYEAFTSGSTGKNFIVREDAYTAGWYRATFLLELEWAGWSIGKPHLQTGMTNNRSLDRQLKDWFLGCHYVDAHRLEDYNLENMLILLEKYHLQFLWGYPGSLYYLAKYAISKGWNNPLKAVVSWGSTLFPEYRKIITEAFSTKVFDTYGCSEGIHIAAQCQHSSYHIHALDAIVEFLDDYNQPVRSGTMGNIIVTRLHPGPMPLIRYKIGDMGVPSSQIACPCGRNFPLMESIVGRSGDVIITPSGNRLLSEYFCGILEYFPEIDTFQVIQETADTVLIKLVPINNLTNEKIEELISTFKNSGASDLIFKILIVDDLPIPPTGKFRYVINKYSNSLD